MKQRKIGDSQQKVGTLEWTENVNENKMAQNQVPSTQRWISGLDYDGPHIFGFFIFWIFSFFGQCPIGHPKHRHHRRGSLTILRTSL
jgi:hypothetical protein